MTERCEKFVGRAIVIDPASGKDSEYSAYVCILLTGEARVPSILLCEAPDFDGLLRKLAADEIGPRLKRAKLTFETPRGAYHASSLTRQRYEALELGQIYRVQGLLSTPS